MEASIINTINAFVFNIITVLLLNVLTLKCHSRILCGNIAPEINISIFFHT